MHSVSGTHPRELFHRLRSINPLDSNLDTRLLASSLQHQTPTEQDAITKRMLNAERGLRTMVALWASSCDQPFIFGLDDTTRSEPPDVPPCFLSTSHDSNVSVRKLVFVIVLVSNAFFLDSFNVAVVVAAF